MNQNLTTIFDFIQLNENLSADEKETFSNAVKEVDKELSITAFKLDCSEKAKGATAILLEETIEELEQKRKVVEAQNRELEIESSLERVRTVAMGMQNPAEMVDVCKIISEQLEFLKVKDIRNVQTAVIYETKGTYINYEYYTRHNQLLTTEVSYKTHHLQQQFANQMLKGAGEFFSPSLEGQQVKDWYEYQKTTNQFADSFLEGAQTLNYYMFSLGPVALGISTYSPLKEEEINLFKRFRNVFELAYRRFTDIQIAEAQAREALIEASLERIRSAAMAMRDSAELGGIIYKLYGELTKLDARLDRCFIMIVNPENKGITWWLAGKEGLLAENGFFVPINQHPSHLMYLESWKNRTKKWQYLFEGKEKRDWDRFGFSKTELVRLPDIIKKDMAAVEKIYLSGSSDEFGSLVTGSHNPLPEEQQDIISRFAIAFNQAFIRFLDLQKAEAQARQAELDLIAIKEAKQKAEEALTELKATQKQLIQSEKMASLGELTAGIAHEIQNPLNFVNNFSEVNTELIDELEQEVEKGNLDEVKALAKDIRENEQKINHHGKRADAIVKGMLQHSRSSNGIKEPTDINALTDEYLRLAYHGLRAKDKSFNATLKTDFDETVGKIDIIPQDIGRVILNLITNAFYACAERSRSTVDEKKKQAGSTLSGLEITNYEPTVSVSTKKRNGTVEITVADNGPGIPQKVLDKIFQPFFTTKPTGQGTGLGLSLAYDIVKAHGGELRVETKEGEGSVFQIILQILN
jgi:signal transduction histidine kinase